MHKAITKVPEEELAKMIEERVAPLGEKLEEISSKLSKKQEPSKNEKIEDIISKMRAKQTEEAKNLKENLKEVKNEHVHDDVSCPSCEKGHVHKINESGRLKCTGDKCGEEFLVIPTHADAYCDNCGLPLKKPEEGKKIDACPGCGGQKAALISKSGIPDLKFDFSKIKK